MIVVTDANMSAIEHVSLIDPASVASMFPAANDPSENALCAMCWQYDCACHAAARDARAALSRMLYNCYAGAERSRRAAFTLIASYRHHNDVDVLWRSTMALHVATFALHVERPSDQPDYLIALHPSLRGYMDAVEQVYASLAWADRDSFNRMLDSGLVMDGWRMAQWAREYAGYMARRDSMPEPDVATLDAFASQYVSQYCAGAYIALHGIQQVLRGQ